MKRIKTIYKKRPFTYAILIVLLVLIPLLFAIREKTGTISQRIAQTAVCDAQTIACDPQFQENKNAACGAFKSVAVDNLLSRDDSPCKGLNRAFVERELTKACTNGCVAATSVPASPTVTITPTGSPSITITATITPTPSITTAPTAGPSATLTLSPTISEGQKSIAISLKVPGIGTGISENRNPIRKELPVGVILYEESKLTEGELIGQYIVESELIFDGNIYKALLPLEKSGNFSETPEATFAVSVQAPYMIISQMEFTARGARFNNSNNVQLAQIIGASGDVTNDGKLDIFDFNFLLHCIQTNECNNALELVDLNSDGVADSKDLNILLRSFALRNN